MIALAPAPTRRGTGTTVLRALVLPMVVGAAYVVASLPAGTAALARRDGLRWLAAPARWSAALAGALPPMSGLLTGIVFALLGYFGALVLVALRHRRADLFWLGVLTTALAAALFHVLAWVLVTAHHVVTFVGGLLAAVLDFLLWLARGVLSLVVFLVTAVAGEDLGLPGWVGVCAAVAGVLALCLRHGPPRLRFGAAAVGAAVGVCLGFAAVVLGLAWLLGLVPDVVWAALGALCVVAVVAVALTVVGQLVLDQLLGTRHAGADRRGVVMGAIAIGSSLGLLMLAGDVFGAYAWYPDAVAGWAEGTVRAGGDPRLDATLTLVVVVASTAGVLRSVGRLRPSPTRAEFGRSLVYGILGSVVAGILLAVSRNSES